MIDAKRVRSFREKNGLTIAEAARQAGMSNRVVWYRIEAGLRKSVSLATIINMARVLKCGVDDLLSHQKKR